MVRGSEGAPRCRSCWSVSRRRCVPPPSKARQRYSYLRVWEQQHLPSTIIQAAHHRRSSVSSGAQTSGRGMGPRSEGHGLRGGLTFRPGCHGPLQCGAEGGSGPLQGGHSYPMGGCPAVRLRPLGCPRRIWGGEDSGHARVAWRAPCRGVSQPLTLGSWGGGSRRSFLLVAGGQRLGPA